MLKKIIIGLVILIIIVIYSLNRTSLTTFQIRAFEQDIEDIYTLNTLFFEESKTAVFYEVKVYDQTNQLLKIYKTQYNYLKIDNLPVAKGSKIYFRVTAYDNHGHYRNSKNKLNHTWALPTIGTNNKYILPNTNLIINVQGVDKESYSLVGMKGEEKFYTGNIDKDTITIPASLIGNYKGCLRFYLIANTGNVAVGSLEVGVEIDEITDMKITYPKNKDKLK
jgi:hypothetical protein